MKITVLSGGFSTERNAALWESTYVTESLRNSGHQVALVDMYMGMEDYDCSKPDDIFLQPIPEKWREVDPSFPDLALLKKSRKLESNGFLGTGVLDLLLMSDVVFLCMGGTYGEDGRIQGMLDILGIPYTGSGHTGTAIALDKILTKEIARQHGIASADWMVLNGSSEVKSRKKDITLPCVVKDPTGGSSIGTYICKTTSELEEALIECSYFNSKILVEQFIPGREFSCGILDDKPLPSVEIITDSHDYANKYYHEITEICPADVSPEVEKQLQSAALKVHQILSLSCYSRSDFILSDSGELYFLECNVLPGLTPRSLLPKEARAVGIDYDQVCNIILESAFQKRSDIV